MDRPSWYEIKNLGNEEADLFIFNEIGYAGVSAEAFMADLRAVMAGKINLHLNSPGGDVFDGIAIYNALKGHPAHVTTYVDALAASIASVIAMAGDHIVMSRHSSMMIHEAHGLAIGNAEDMSKMAERLDVVSDQIAGVYKDRVPGSKTLTWRNRMKEETWYTEKEAVAAGLADEVGAKVAAQNSFDLSKFHNVPEAISSESEARKHCPDPEDAPPEPVIVEPDPPAPAEEPFDQAAALRQAASVEITEVI